MIDKEFWEKISKEWKKVDDIEVPPIVVPPIEIDDDEDDIDYDDILADFEI